MVQRYWPFMAGGILIVLMLLLATIIPVPPGPRPLAQQDWVAHLPIACAALLTVLVVDGLVITKIRADRRARAGVAVPAAGGYAAPAYAPAAAPASTRFAATPTAPHAATFAEQATLAIPQARAILQAAGGASRGTVWEIGAGGATLGRSSSNTIVIADGKVSGLHAQIEFKPSSNSFVLTDQNSKNGTFVNRARIGTGYQLKNGDSIQLGDTEISVSL